jgi:phosphoribosylformylglycinamidine cyclo-ligase
VIFSLIQRGGVIADDEMLRTFNMGIGLVIVCRAQDEDRVLDVLADAGERDAVRIGRIVPGDRVVRYG